LTCLQGYGTEHFVKNTKGFEPVFFKNKKLLNLLGIGYKHLRVLYG